MLLIGNFHSPSIGLNGKIVKAKSNRLASFYVDNIGMPLQIWIRTNDRIKELRTTQEAVAKESGIKYQTLRGWVTKEVLPRADDAAAIAKALSTTVEYLVDGEEGAAYVRELIAREGIEWHAPEKIREIVDDLNDLDETRFTSAKSMVHDAAENARRDRAATSNQQGRSAG